jgi:hypothetical protein
MTRATEPRATPTRTDRVAAARIGGATLLLLLGSLALFWPGIVTYDGIAQFQQALSGEFEDWHPPIMARLWHGLHGLFGGGAEPLLVLQMVFYWAGFGLIAATLARDARRRAAIVVLLVAILPLFVGWQGVVLKDTQMLGAMLAASGIIAWWRLRGARLPLAALIAVLVLLAYATLVRSNAVFATVPLVVLLFGPKRWWARALLTLGGIVAVLALAQAINHHVLGAGASGVERTEAFYDLAAVAAQDPTHPVGLTRAEARAVVALHCAKPFFWDPLGTPDRCGPTLERLHGLTAGPLYRLLGEAIVRHPLAYATHRLAHLNSTERWLVPAGWPSAVPPGATEANPVGLRSPGAAAQRWQALARINAETPLGWPIAWVALALCALVVALRRASAPPRDFALALLGSAIVLEASFGVLSIASDLRYHLWPMVATALATIVLSAEARWSRRALAGTAMVLALAIVPAMVARLVLPAPATSYAAMLR